jgi:hypothetical protein
MSKRDWTGAAIGVLVMAGTLAAQPDPLVTCRNRASVLANVPPGGVAVQKRGGLDNGNYIIWWDAKWNSSRTVKGFCEANPLTGRIVRMGTSQTDSMSGIRQFRITLDDAERVCQREARARFSPGNGLLGARVVENLSTKDTYRVAWEYNILARPIRRGRCEIDSSTGSLLSIHADRVW